MTPRALEARRRLDALLAEFAAQRRPIRVVRKRAYWHQRVAAVLLKAITFGGQDRYLDAYVTTLGRTIYVPDGFDAWDPGHAWEVLRHEAVHVAQFDRWGWVGMIMVYGLLPLPLGLAYGRARLEWEAYTMTLRCIADLDGLAAARSARLHDDLVARFTGPDYGWMWPFPTHVRRWIADALDEIEREMHRREHDELR